MTSERPVTRGNVRRIVASIVFMGTVGLLILAMTSATTDGAPPTRSVSTPYVVFGYNDLGMHCMNQDFSELCVLPPYNTLHAQVVDRTHESPDILTSDITVEYVIPANTRSADKTNFWTYANALFGANLPPNVGLTGHGLSGALTRTTGTNDYSVTGIPITPTDDTGRENPYNLATITVKQGGAVMAITQAVVPVSWEMSCNLCHNAPGVSTATDILRAHDRLHGTQLETQKPVLCAGCHADNALGTPGVPGVPNLSSAMHLAHASRMSQAGLANECYACHPGVRTKCQRDVHLSHGLACNDCHTSMTAVGDPARRPWIDEPTCGGCHQAQHPTWEFEEPGKLYRDSRGHRGIHCSACHGSPHAITPTVTVLDNIQAIAIQGHAGRIDTCTVCHRTTPSDPFPHRLTDD